MYSADGQEVPPPRVLAVLGMHRSGTSMLMGSLQEAGVHLGKVFADPIRFNRKGLMEPKAILFMQEDLLQKNGGSWSDPPDAIEWQPLHVAVRDLFIESMSAHPLWGFKDPRTLFTFDGWRAALPSLEATGIFRHPAEVASSLHQRNGFNKSKSMAIWMRYNQRLLELQRLHRFPLIEFVADSDTMHAALTRLFNVLQLQAKPAPQKLTFFDASVRQHERDEEALPQEVAALYSHLQEAVL